MGSCYFGSLDKGIGPSYCTSGKTEALQGEIENISIISGEAGQFLGQGFVKRMRSELTLAVKVSL